MKSINRIQVALSMISGYLFPGVTNSSANFQGDVENYIADKVLPLAQRWLVAYQFGQALRLPPNRGTTYTASRYIRLNLPYAPLQEGVAPVGEQMTLQQVQATAQQWGDKVTVTDVADLTIKHPLFQQAIKLVAQQMPETLERNTFNTLLSAVQVNYVNGRASRAAIQPTDVLSPHEVDRAVGSLQTYGAPEYNGDEREDIKRDANTNKKYDPAASASHYVALIHPLVTQDMRENASVANAWSYSDVNRMYTNEIGDWGGVRFCKSNMIPFWTGATAIQGSGSDTGGALGAATYYIQVTASPAATSVEQTIYQVSTGIAIGSSIGSISVALPNVPNVVFNVYIGTTTSPANLGLSSAGPSTGPLAGQATQLAGNQTVTITGVGAAQTPPAAPATGVTVYPTIVLGYGAYGQVMLDDVRFFYLKDADKSDPLNQLRVVSWKVFYGTIILNQAFMMRVEGASAFSSGYNAGTVTT